MNKYLEQRLSSREVAPMMDMGHPELLRKIRNINEDFNQSKIAFVKYWGESSYVDAKGEKRSEFLITKRGCEFLAHKTTGTKGNLFTDRYMDKFEQMENQLSIGKNNQNKKAIEGLSNIIGDMQKTIAENKETIEEYKSMCKINCSKKRNYADYIKKRLGIIKTNSEFEQIKTRVFFILNVNKWEDIDLETSKNILNVIDESITIIKRERPYRQMSYFE